MSGQTFTIKPIVKHFVYVQAVNVVRWLRLGLGKDLHNETYIMSYNVSQVKKQVKF